MKLHGEYLAPGRDAFAPQANAMLFAIARILQLPYARVAKRKLSIGLCSHGADVVARLCSCQSPQNSTEMWKESITKAAPGRLSVVSRREEKDPSNPLKRLAMHSHWNKHKFSINTAEYPKRSFVFQGDGSLENCNTAKPNQTKTIKEMCK